MAEETSALRLRLEALTEEIARRSRQFEQQGMFADAHEAYLSDMRASHTMKGRGPASTAGTTSGLDAVLDSFWAFVEAMEAAEMKAGRR